MWQYMDGMGWWMLFGGTWMFIFWGGLIALIIWVVVKLTKKSDSSLKQNPLNIARERYAKGEISKEEFEQLKKDLT